jgi:type III secretion protein F
MSIMGGNGILTFTGITQTMSNAISQQEAQLQTTLQQIQSDGSNLSQSQLVAFQARLQLWSSLIQMESSVVKVYGDTMKQVVSNMGS